MNATKDGLKIIKKEKIDLIHSNNFSPALTGGILSFLTKKPHITSIWDVFSLCGSNYWKKWVEQKGISKFYSFIGPRFEKLTIKIPCKAIHTISKATYDDLIKFGAKKPIYVINPCLEKIEKKSNPFDPLQFLYIGRLVFYKNVEILIKSIGVVKKTFPNIKLIIVGDGPQKDLLKKMIRIQDLESNIIMKGYISTDEKLNLISQSNSLLFPSFCEGFGLVILEAFSHKKPVFVSDIRPMSEIISHEKNGFVLNPNDEKIWANYLIRVIKNPSESEKMGEYGKQSLDSEYNQEKMYEEIVKMYKNNLGFEPT